MKAFSAEVKARGGGLFYADPIMSGPIFRTRQDAERWCMCIHVIVENNYRGGPSPRQGFGRSRGW